MENLLWDIFFETGDPMGYLYLRAEEREKERKGERTADGSPAPAPDAPQASA